MAEMFLDPLRIEDTDALFRFETENRDWFEGWVGPRPDTYWQLDQLRALIQAQIAEDDLMYLIKSGPAGKIQGRLNLTALTGGVGQIGYRIGRDFCGRGLATQAVERALGIAREVGLWALEARVSDSNPASQQVLARNGFGPDASVAPVVIHTSNGAPLTITTYRLLLD